MWGQGHPKRSPSLLPICLGPGRPCRQQDVCVTPGTAPAWARAELGTRYARSGVMAVSTQDRQVVLTDEIFRTQGTWLSLGP